MIIKKKNTKYNYGQGTSQTEAPTTINESAKLAAEKEALRMKRQKEEAARLAAEQAAQADKEIGANLQIEPKSATQQATTQTETINDPNYRTTIQGDRFSLTGGISSNEFSSKESYEQAKRILQNEGAGGYLDSGELGISQTEYLAQQEAAQNLKLSNQIGDYDELSVSPTGLNTGEAITTGIVGAIPGALKLAVTGAGIGAAGGAIAGGVGAIPGAAIGAVAGFVSGLSSSMISNYKSQRSDTTTAQQRVLDEGKQTMADWATLAASDPANKSKYLAEYNKQAAQIDQAYRQMKLDTNRDLAKFETALPNLAEFESFYSAGGERDTLNIEMRNALTAAAPEGYNLLELKERSEAWN